MSLFLADAEGLLATATAGSASDASLDDVAIWIDPDGAVQMRDASGWQLRSLQLHTGARRIYRITRKAGSVRVEGLSGPDSCVLETERGRLGPESASFLDARRLEIDRGLMERPAAGGAELVACRAYGYTPRVRAYDPAAQDQYERAHILQLEGPIEG